jgi:protein-S-isoprenylcysteine O-methyltransferase Ste14
MFSGRLERRRKNRRWAVVVAATVLAVGLAMIGVVAIRGFDMLGAADADWMPMVLGVLVALAGLGVLCLAAYVVVRAYGRVTSG